MNKMNLISRTGIATLALAALMGACKSGAVYHENGTETPSQSDQIVSEVKTQYAPDTRMAHFDIEAVESGESVLLKGESNLPDAVKDLKTRLQQQNIAFTDSIRLLPSADLEGKTEGVIKISVANLRSAPSHSAELVTQAILGTPVKVYKKDGGWYYIQTPEGYLAWTDYGGVTPVTPQELNTWRAAEKIIFLDTYGFSYTEPSTRSQKVSDLVTGNILELLGEENG